MRWKTADSEWLVWMGIGLLLALALLCMALYWRKSGRIDVACVSGRGKRSSQQDAIGIAGLESPRTFRKYGCMAVVADGMGGMAMGDVMSSETVEAFQTVFKQLRGNESKFLLGQMIREAQHRTRQKLEENGGKAGGSTAAAVIVRGRSFSYVSVGDSRIALLRNGRLTALTKPHNYGEELDELAKKGAISKVEARTNPRRKALTSYIGTEAKLKLDMAEEPIPLKSGDWIFIMSDGIETLTDAELCACVAKTKSAVWVAREIEARIKSKDLADQDNYSAVIIKIHGNRREKW